MGGLIIKSVKISIIIPIYNVEKYLQQCLESVINQTLEDIEIICVNDGSTDGSQKILEEYSYKDKRIKIINKKNAGLGAARNTGLEYANGEYIGFVDSDDWIDTTMYEKLYKNAKFYNSDIVICQIRVVNEFDELSYSPYYDLECFNDDFKNCVFDYKKTKDFITKINVNAYNKIFKTKFIREINAKFPEGLIFEDNPFFYYTYLNADNISIVKNYLYFHRVNRQGSIITEASKKFFDTIEINNQIMKIFSKIPNYEEYEKLLLNRKITTIMHRYTQVSNEYRQEFFKLIKADFKKMDLKGNILDSLSIEVKNNYLSIIASNSPKEFELSKQINQLILENNKLRKKLRCKDNEMKEISNVIRVCDI